MAPLGDLTIDRSQVDDLNHQAILIWTEFQVSKGLELDIEWAGHFQPLLRAPGHEGSGYARVQKRPDTILLVTAWERASDMRAFTASPSAQLYRENLEARGIRAMSSRKTFSRRSSDYVGPRWFDALTRSYVELFWIYFSTPVTDTQKTRISDSIGIREPPVGIGGVRHGVKRLQTRWPLKIWAIGTEHVHGQEAQLMLWPHFWTDAESAEYRHVGKYSNSGHLRWHARTLLEKFGDELESLGALEWKEEFCDFKLITLA
ncbi:Dimeric alpha-beta barrel [Penicillium cf. viridicatum]|uniref:Dimeric alpha-beta barrel n=1 Tax=Penicillium cf. viridicatum TaxID=2972119 RepID=A0A9W9MBN9_9EURO|nr:Dimeric alpha-beta barrel [Penicillium cf. viridicatum]